MEQKDLYDSLVAIVGARYVLCDPNSLEAYARDETREHHHMPDFVVKPSTTHEISRILVLCDQTGIPLVARGGGSGVSGGALAVRGGVVLLMERLKRVLAVDHNNMTITVETGAITAEVQALLLEQGLCLPPDPGSRSWSQIGGNLAEAAAGPKTVKYGAFRDYVLNLEIVLANGEVLWTGANVRKMACGYNLTQLMLGSEGTLAVITKVVFKLIPAIREELVLRLAFSSLAKARDMICATFDAGLVPSELEFMEAGAIEVARGYCKEHIEDGVEALLWIGFDGLDELALIADAEQVSQLADGLVMGEVLMAQEPNQRHLLWEYRHKVGEAIIDTTPFLDVDVSYPRSSLLEVVEGTRKIGTRMGFKVVAFGHSGDGNLHVQILRGDLDEAVWKGLVRDGVRQIYTLVTALGGALSGEHGIGCSLIPYLDTLYSKTHLELMSGIKRVFDPNNTLNPGKIFPHT